MIIFISGGARSGKSQFAEQTALSYFDHMKKENHNVSLRYIATAKKSDDEMVERIRIHQHDRGETWHTFEESFHLEPILSNFNKGDVILLDCMTIWVSNVMFELGLRLEEMEERVNRWLSIARENQFHLLIVSNDVNEGIPHRDNVVQSYMYTLQRLHYNLVQQSDIAVQVQAGIPLYWKGEI